MKGIVDVNLIGLNSYPDLLVVCGELNFREEHRDVLLNQMCLLSPARLSHGRRDIEMPFSVWVAGAGRM